MSMQPDIRVALAAIGSADCDAIAQAMRSQGWQVAQTQELDELIAMVESGQFHVAVLACAAPREVPREAAMTLVSLLADMSVLFLVPDRAALLECPALTVTTSDHVHNLDMPPAEFLEIVKAELVSVLANQPEYAVLCVDDDNEFLASLEEFLPDRLEEAFPRFTLDFQFFALPQEALGACQEPQMRQGKLAVVISDQMMPQMKGIELLTAIRRLCPRTQQVLLTGHAGIDSAITAINEQVLDRYLVKPIERPADFANCIRQLLREHHLRLSRDAQRQRLTAQFEFIRTISAVRDIARALNATEEFLTRELSASHVKAFLAEKHELVLGAGGDRPAGGADDPATLSVCEWVLRHQRPILATSRQDLPAELSSGPAPVLPLTVLPLSFCDVRLGVLVVAGREADKPFTRDEQRLISFVADAVAVTTGGLTDRAALQQHYLDTMASLMEAVEAKDRYTRGHTDRVRELTVALAKAAGLSGEDLANIERAAALHDIGKIGVPDGIISKPTRLTAEEYACIKDHPIQGDRILQHLNFLDAARAVVRSHHERYDGKGYPDGLAGEQIPLGARILAITDSYDAMTSARPYRQAMPPEEALAEIEVNAGTQFDPGLTKLFVEMLKANLAPPPLRQSDAKAPASGRV